MNAALARQGRGHHCLVSYRADTSKLDAAFFDLELALIRFEIPVWRARYAAEREVPELVDLGGES